MNQAKARKRQNRRKIPPPPGFLRIKTVTVYDPVTGAPVQAKAQVFRAPTAKELLDRDWLHSSWRPSGHNSEEV